MANKPQEYSLDPSSDEEWDELKKITHQAIDELFDHLKNIDKETAWKPIPKETIEKFQKDLPLSSTPVGVLYNQFKSDILPYPSGNIHPRFWGYAQGTGSPAGVLAEILTAVMNCNVGGRDQIANHVEREVIEWSKKMLGYHPDASGVLTSGCSVANLIALAVARNAKSGNDVKADGIQNNALTFYASTQAHSAVPKAVELLGLGSNALRLIDVDDHFRMDVNQLRKAIEQDKQNGRLPACVIASIGSVNTGSIDPLPEIISIGKEHNIWVHADAAFGAFANLCSDYKDRLKSVGELDSIAFDFHKWMYMPYDVGCVLVKDEKAHRRTFSHRPEYLESLQRGLGGGGRWFSEYGIQLSRSFRALKVWFLLKLHGINHYTKLIEQNINQAKYLAGLVEKEETLELCAPVDLNIVCFRYRNDRLNSEELNKRNQEILFRLQEGGKVAPSSTRLGDKFAVRVAVVNHRSRQTDFDLLLSEVMKTARAIENERA